MLKKGHVQHIHPNCKCTFAVRFSEDMDVEGYNPEKYLRQYNNAEGYSWQDKINSMRRARYAEKKRDEELLKKGIIEN